MEYYITKAGSVACVQGDAWSVYHRDELPRGFAEPPPQTERLAWRRVDYSDLPTWAQEQFVNAAYRLR